MERRKHRRLPIQLPLTCKDAELTDRVLFRTKTLNVSTGGLYFETLSQDVRLGQVFSLEMIIPPGDGHFPYQGRVTTRGQVVRIDELPPRSGAEGIAQLPRRGVAATFNANLKLSF